MEKMILFFDADETLWDEQVVLQRLESEINDIVKINDENSDFISEFIKNENHNIPLIGYGFPSYTFSLLETLSSKPYWYEIKPEIISLYSKTYEKLTKHSPDVFKNTVEVLSNLSNENYDLYVLTRGIHSEQLDKFRRSNLGDFFKDIFVVQDKSEKSYIEISNSLNMKPSNIWMIGNSIRSDIIPAHNVGYKTIWIPNDNEWNHDQTEDIKKPRETFMVNDIIEVIDIVRKHHS